MWARLTKWRLSSGYSRLLLLSCDRETAPPILTALNPHWGPGFTSAPVRRSAGPPGMRGERNKRDAPQALRLSPKGKPQERMPKAFHLNRKRMPIRHSILDQSNKRTPKVFIHFVIGTMYYYCRRE